MQVYLPYQITDNGRTATTGEERHVRDLIEGVLFTAPGERVNRPTFGSGIEQLVFAPNSEELAATTESLVQGALLQWLEDVIKVEAVEVKSEEATLRVTVRYIVLEDQQRRVSTFERSLRTP